jgi:hypothetical protein
MPADFDPQVIGPVIVTYFVGRVADGLDLQQPTRERALAGCGDSMRGWKGERRSLL